MYTTCTFYKIYGRTFLSIFVYKYLFSSFQLYSLNDYKPPISKAKMTQITKAAIKAIKVLYTDSNV